VWPTVTLTAAPGSPRSVATGQGTMAMRVPLLPEFDSWWAYGGDRFAG
jgi:hypothetical protein